MLVSPYPKQFSFFWSINASTGGAFNDIRSISNAYKHLYENTSRKGKSEWTIASSGSLECVDFRSADQELQSIEVDYDIAKDKGGMVTFRRRDGTKGHFLPTLDVVIKFWSAKLF